MWKLMKANRVSKNILNGYFATLNPKPYDQNLITLRVLATWPCKHVSLLLLGLGFRDSEAHAQNRHSV